MTDDLVKELRKRVIGHPGLMDRAADEIDRLRAALENAEADVVNLDSKVACMKARIVELEADAVVPGQMECAKCKFVLQRTNLYMASGTTGPGNNETEPCPNGCGPLWPSTWKQDAYRLGERLEQMFDEKKNEVVAARAQALEEAYTIAASALDNLVDTPERNVNSPHAIFVIDAVFFALADARAAAIRALAKDCQ